MVSALILVANGSEEIEFVTPYDVFVRAGMTVRSASVGSTPITLSRGVKIQADCQLSDLGTIEQITKDHDVLVLPGGVKGAEIFQHTQFVIELMRCFYYSSHGKKLLCVICASCAIIDTAGIHANKRLTSHPSVKQQLTSHYNYSEDRVVVDGDLITSRGPGTALLFALTIVEKMLGSSRRDEIEGPMMLPASL